jgi:hypothetical protein
LADRNGGGRTHESHGETRDDSASGYPTSGDPIGAENSHYSLGNNAEKSAIGGISESRPKAARLEWQQVNAATWRLADPDGPGVRVNASHGQWGGYETPKAVAWVFDVGANGAHDWRVRVRKRGGWFALGSLSDADIAKRLAQAAVDGAPYRNIPPEIPLNLLGGARWPNKRNDRRTIAKVIEAEVGGELMEPPE